MKKLYSCLLIIDDWAEDRVFMRYSKILHGLYTKSRHFGLSVITSSQKLNALAPIVRLNTSSLYIFKLIQNVLIPCISWFVLANRNARCHVTWTSHSHAEMWSAKTHFRHIKKTLALKVTRCQLGVAWFSEAPPAKGIPRFVFRIFLHSHRTVSGSPIFRHQTGS